MDSARSLRRPKTGDRLGTRRVGPRAARGTMQSRRVPPVIQQKVIRKVVHRAGLPKLVRSKVTLKASTARLIRRRRTRARPNRSIRGASSES